MFRRMAYMALMAGFVLSASARAQNTPAARKQATGKGSARSIDPSGRPDGQIHDQSARFYVWHDKSGWHIRTTAKVVRRFHGTIRVTDARIKSCLPVGLKERQKGGGDAFRVNGARSELQFQFRTSTASDGFDLELDDGDGEIEFDLAIDEQRNAKTVFIGKGRKQPGKVPFSFPSTPVKTK